MKTIVALAAFVIVFVSEALAISEHLTFSTLTGAVSVHTNLSWEAPTGPRYGDFTYTIYRKVPYTVNGVTYYNYNWVADTSIYFYHNTSSIQILGYWAFSENSNEIFYTNSNASAWNQTGDSNLYLHGLDPGSYVIEISAPDYGFSGPSGSWGLNWSETYQGKHGSLYMYVSE